MKTLMQVAQLTGINVETLRKRAQKGTLKAQKLGKTWLVSEQTLNKLLHGEDSEGEQKHST